MTSNGSTWKLDLKPPTETTTFTIGGQNIEVPALTLLAMEIVKDELLALGPDLDMVVYARNVVRIVYKLFKNAHPDVELEEHDLVAACSINEMRQLALKMNELMGLSGMDGGPTRQDQTASPETTPGPGTSTNSSPDSPPTASAAETSTG